ncbi:MAG: PLP-dependent aminotransferase family protein [Gammaproteobacteria bacterium]|nr:PLP-dependent aminotransferase family protein [Gammaproteobacteria bacterium]MBU2287753.1 PLP-dependent aminotransferase family protein [Gammaproteobacteria bacterium]
MSKNDPQGPLFWRRVFKRFESRDASLQAQLRDALMHAVLEGALAPGERVPSSRWLADCLAISRTTTSLVLQRLSESGVLAARARSGYVVHPEFRAVRVEDDTIPARTPAAAGSAASTRPGRIALRLSSQRNIEKPRDWQSYDYPFIYGQFDPSLFPFSEWRECVLESLRKGEIARWAPDHIDRDNVALIDQIRRRLLPARGIWVDADNILMTAGAQQATYLLATLLCERTTRVGIENPGYPDARNSFSLHSDHVIPLPVDADGLLVTAAMNRCRYIYVTPSHQCPTTVTMTLERRLALLERARRHGIVIIEDDHESELNHLGSPTAALKSLDGGDHVIYIGSLSKTLAHGLRLGYIVASAPLIRELRALRRLMLRHPPTNNEHAAANFIRHGFHEALVRRLNRNYRDRAKELGDALERHLPEASFAKAHGGSALWVQLPQHIDTTKLARQVLGRGVVVEPGEVFFHGDERPRCYVRLGYSSIDARQIDDGVKILAEVARQRR